MNEQIEIVNAKDSEYVVITNLGENATWLTREMAEKVEDILDRNGWTVEIREPRSNGEAEGTYYRKRDGTLQILGYSIPKPSALIWAINQAADSII
jgi:hypothetical protein